MLMDYFELIMGVARGQAQAVKLNLPRTRPCVVCGREAFAIHTQEDGGQIFECPAGHCAAVVHGRV
jgi:hypothetical protein